MLNFLKSLSLLSGSLFVAALSVVALLVAIRVLPRAGQWLVGSVTPFVIAYVVYWSPVWLGTDPSGYSAWLWLSVGAWGAAGLLANSALAFGVAFKRRRYLQPGGA